MFSYAKLFDADISKWDVSRVKDMNGMFRGATIFNGDLTKWDVSSVKDMHGMFWGATLFKRKLCGGAWVHSKAKKTAMFEGTSGSISSTVCAISKPAFSPRSRVELKCAVDARIEDASNEKMTGGVTSRVLTMNTGATIPRVALGVWRIKPGHETYKAIKMALATGYRHIDTGG